MQWALECVKGLYEQTKNTKRIKKVSSKTVSFPRWKMGIQLQEVFKPLNRHDQ